MNDINRDNCRILFAAFIEDNELDCRLVAKAIDCSEATIVRILAARSLPSDEFLKQSGMMIEIGFVPYSNLTDAQKENISEKIGTVVGGILGFGSISATIGSLGAVGGLSAAGVTSGLAALGSIIGGGMIVGVTVAAAIPMAACAVGYGISKGVNHLLSEQALSISELDERWELTVGSDSDEA